MKRALSLISALVIAATAIAAPLPKDLSKLKTDIYSFLEKARTSPQYMSENKIMFSDGGTAYMLTISLTDVHPMYITIASTFNLDGDFDPQLVATTAQNINNNKMVKFTNGDDWVTFQAEMYLSNAAAFTSVYPKIIGSLQDARLYFESYYDEIAESPQPSRQSTAYVPRDSQDAHPTQDAQASQVSYPSEDIQDAQTPSDFSSSSTPIVVRGDIISTSHHDWECLSVQTDDEKTILTKRVVPKTRRSTIFSSYMEYIEDADTGKKYYLEDSEIGFEDEPETITDGSTRIFSETYPPLPPTVRRINISGGSQYYIKNLPVK